MALLSELHTWGMTPLSCTPVLSFPHYIAYLGNLSNEPSLHAVFTATSRCQTISDTGEVVKNNGQQLTS